MDMDNKMITGEMSNHNSKRKHNTTTDLPQKKYFRQRAHSNPMADHDFKYPIKPKLMDWSTLYPEWNEQIGKKVEFADLGCGYGGLLVTLSPLFPETFILGMEIRVKVSDYVINRIKALRENYPGQYKNIACVRTNAMKYMPNFFNKGQLKKMFFLYPDPHFKKCKYKWRIINDTLLAEYAYLLAEEGMLYTVTDVYDLHDWIVTCIGRHPLFKKIPDHMLLNDKICDVMLECSEEGQKVTRNNGQKYIAVFTRISDPVEPLNE